MWTYHPENALPANPPARPAGPPQAGQKTEQKTPPRQVAPQAPTTGQALSAPPKPARLPAAEWRERRMLSSRRLYRLLGGCYLTGVLLGALSPRFLGGVLRTYAEYAAGIQLNLYTQGQGALVFSAGFLSLFCQLSAALLAGFCVLGVGLLPLLLAVKGVGNGLFLALLYQQAGPAKGLLLQALVFWLPEVLGCLLLLATSCMALQLSHGLLRHCRGLCGQDLPRSAKKLLYRYLAACFGAMTVSGLALLLVLVFGRLF